MNETVMPTDDAGESVAGLFLRVRPRLLAIVARHRIPPADAEDLIQDTFVCLLRSKGLIEAPEPWLVGTFRNRCLQYLRARRRSERVQSLDEQLLDAVAPPRKPEQEQTERQRDLATLVAGLPRPFRHLLRLRYGLGLTTEEIAARLGYCPASIRKLASRALERVRRVAISGR
jgi:RNA polymerase sigma factor (sigma-70 family)